jgi:hypothetical protein
VRQPARYWFRRKRNILGWGWTPISIEGWLVLAAFLVIVYGGNYISTAHLGMSVVWAPIIWAVINIVALIAIVVAKAEPVPKP